MNAIEREAIADFRRGERIEDSEKPTCVRCEGPHSCQNRDGDEYPVWSVSLCNDDGDELDEPKDFICRATAISAAKQIAKKRGIEFVNEAGYE